MATERKLLVGAVALMPGRVRGDTAAGSRARDEVEALLIPEFFQNAPFDRVSVLLRYGERTRLQPDYQPIGVFDGARELPVALELEMNRLRRIKPEEVFAIFRQALLDALLAVAAKYGLRAERLQQARSELPTLIGGMHEAPLRTDAPPAPRVLGLRKQVPGGEPSASDGAAKRGDAGEAVDETGTRTMPSLYRGLPGRTLYWETWEDNDGIAIHFGALGERGETTRLPLTPSARDQVQAEAERRRSEGYAEVSDEDLATVILQYPVVGFGTAADLERRYKVQALMNNRLGWTGLGHCDGGDIGSDTMNVFCLVVDPALAVPVIVRELEQSGQLEGVIVGIEAENDEVEVLWPPDYQDKFSP